jgi:hypothetical protein
MMRGCAGMVCEMIEGCWLRPECRAATWPWGVSRQDRGEQESEKWRAYVMELKGRAGIA